MTPFSPNTDPAAGPADPTAEISRRQAITAALRSAAGFAAIPALGILPMIGGCQSNKGWTPLADDDPSLNGPLGRAPLNGTQARGGASGGASLTQMPSGVISRTQWTHEKTIASEANRMVHVNRITVHHDGMPPVTLRSKSAVMNRLEMIRRSHVNARGWADIGYHFVVDPLGNVWEARPLFYQGAHVKDNNPNNMGVMVLGNFEEQTPTRAALVALDRFLQSQMSRHSVSVSQLVTHQELAPTACPGRSLQQHMNAARSGSGLLG